MRKFSAIFNEKIEIRERCKGIRFQNGAKECIVQISARAFQRVFTCKNRRPYSRERAPRSLGGKFNSIFTSLLNYGTLAAQQKNLPEGAPSWTNHELFTRVNESFYPPTLNQHPHRPTRAQEQRGEWIMNWIFPQTLRGSFSAVSTPIFASKYSLESSSRDLQDLHTFAPLRPQLFKKFRRLKFKVSTKNKTISWFFVRNRDFICLIHFFAQFTEFRLKLIGILSFLQNLPNSNLYLQTFAEIYKNSWKF